MFYIETGSCSPAVNLAYEEYFLKVKPLEEDICMLWRNEPAVIVGKFQNTLEEIDLLFAETNHIDVIRRISGGGAVYHDLGNLCFSFILNGIAPYTLNRPALARPLVNALRQFGLPVDMTQRNDLVVDGKKFSGNAMALHKNRLLYHGTLLFDTDLERLTRVLRSAPAAVESKAVKSVRTNVTNLKPYIRPEIDILQFKQALKEYLLAGNASKPYDPTAEDCSAIQDLVENKYQTWEWTFGNNPSSKITLSGELPIGYLIITIELEKGRIQHCRLQKEKQAIGSEAIEQRLINVRYRYEDIRTALEGLEPTDLPGHITPDELARMLFEI